MTDEYMPSVRLARCSILVETRWLFMRGTVPAEVPGLMDRANFEGLRLVPPVDLGRPSTLHTYLAA